MNILILGSGGREHAFAWKIAQSDQCKQLFIAPGNAGTAQIGTNLELTLHDFESIKKAVLQHHIKLVIVGPEKPLVEGLADFFKEDPQLQDLLFIGPSKRGAQLEGSKEFAKKFMERHHIPTAAYQSFTAETLAEGKAFLESLQPPYVLKADGLAGGKGVLILDSLEEAKKELANMLTQQKFGEASQTVVIEEFLSGIELSVFVLTDGESYKILPSAKDYKRIGEGDTGLNTGGMGAISPVPFATPRFLEKVEQQIVIPTIKGLKEENIAYRGFIFLGLMKVGEDPYVIEYNVRMGDPETEVVLPRLSSDLVSLLVKTAQKQLKESTLTIKEETAATVMLVSGGYPEKYEKGKKITGLEKVKGVEVFQAGTRKEANSILTNGGRVIALTGLGTTYKKALKKVYTQIKAINFDKKSYRRDIGKDLEKY